jgi:cobalamin biosynthesis Mg chelatase CobN
MLGLAATTHAMVNRIWPAIEERYLSDQEMQEKLVKNNQYAATEIANRLLKAERRG